MCLEDNTHAVFPSHCALLHILRLPSQFLKMNRAPTVSPKTSCFITSKLLLLPFKCYYETAVMKISLISINCCVCMWVGWGYGWGRGGKQTEEISGMPTASCGAHLRVEQHCGFSVIKITLPDTVNLGL